MTGLQLSRQSTAAGLATYQLPCWNHLALPHAISTRLGGVSEGPFASLNLGIEGCSPAAASKPSDTPDNVLRNYTLLAEAVGCIRRTLTRISQVHGNRVVVAGAAKPNGPQEADAIVTNDPRRLLAIRVADCVPILVANADGSVVGAIHAGWRGVVAGVVGATLDELKRTFGVVSSEVTAAIGPCIGVDCFEVGPEVAAEFVRVGLRECVHEEAGRKSHVDLRGAVREQLLIGGVGAERIAATDRCTFRDRDEFFSHRRDKGVTGRMAAVIGCR